MTATSGERYAEGYGLQTLAYLEHVDPTLAPVHRRLVELARVRAGDRLLDVATGTGAVARLAAEAGAQVVGVDISPGMVGMARAVSPPSLKFEVADAASLPFADEHFDAATCGFGFSHLPDPVRCLREARRVLRPGARLVESSWGSDGVSEAFSAVLGVLKAHSPGGIHAFAGILDEDTWADADRGRDVVRAAGFSEVDVLTERLSGRFDAPSQALDWALAWPDYGVTARALDASAQARLAEDALAALKGRSLEWWFDINYYVAVR